MTWQDEVDEIERRKQMAFRMGGEERVAFHHAQGKLTARERIDLLSDAGSFREFMVLSGSGTYVDGELAEFIPKPAVTGFSLIEGRKAVISAGDFTVRGGSGGGGGGILGQELGATRRALEWRLPYIRLLDAAGGSVRHFEEIGRTYLPDGNNMVVTDVALLRSVPVVAAVLGSVAGLPAVDVCLSHFSVMVKDTSQVFPGGPPVVKAALGVDISKEDLGGYRVHTRLSGVVDNLAETESEALAITRRFLGYLPSNVWSMPPRLECADPPDRRDESLLSIIPRDRRRPYSAHKILEAVLDEGSFFEIAPGYGRARITGFGRLNGYPVGVMANNPLYLGGATDVAAGAKTIRLIQLCDTFHLPLISFADEPGVMVGPESERQGIERAGAQLMMAVCDSSMPWLTVVTGQLFGVAGACHHRPTGMFQRYVWPSASWGSMHIEGGTTAAYRREIESANDKEAKRLEIEARLKAIGSPFRTAEQTGQDIIDPRETRELLCEFVEDAQPILRSQLGQTGMPYRP
ncbi:MAG TPA: carboxyl transferase domain-containing protein [Dehalococcoidia bacterium]